MPEIDIRGALPGDIIGFETGGAFGKLIGVAQTIKRDPPEFRDIHHIGILADLDLAHPDDVTKWMVVQAARRVDEVPLAQVAPGRPFKVFACPNGVNRQAVVNQARACLRDEYGVLSIVSIALTLETPEFIDFRTPNTWICSALGAYCLHAGGWLHMWPDLFQVRPAQLCAALA